MGYPNSRGSSNQGGQSLSFLAPLGGLGAASGAAEAAAGAAAGLSAAGLAARAGSRLFPWLAAAMAAYEAYQLYLSLWDPIASGATAVCTTGGGYLGPHNGASTCNTTHSGNEAGVAPGSFSVGWHYDIIHPTNPAFTQSKQSYTMTLPNPKMKYGRPPPIYNPTRPEPLAPWEVPWLNPWHLPIMNPAWEFPSLPWAVPPYRTDPAVNPDPSPIPSPKPRPKPAPSPTPLPNPSPWPDPAPSPEPSPSPSPSPHPAPDPWPYWPVPPDYEDPWNFPSPEPADVRRQKRRARKRRPETATLPGGGGSMTIVRGGPPLSMPPGKHVRERKLRGKLASMVWHAANNVTEARDFVQSIHQALPAKYKTKKKGKHFGKHGSQSGPSMQQMLKDIYKGLGDPAVRDSSKFWNDALDNLITDQIKDYVFGKIGQAQAGANAASGRPIGYGAGPAL